MRYVIDPDPSASPQCLGRKGAALAAVKGTDVLIPPWFAVSPEAFKESLGESAWQALSNSPDLCQATEILAGLKPCSRLDEELREGLARLCPNDERIAVRSSATDEDGVEHSSAGQLESFLFVSPAEALDRISDVWRSGYSKRVYAYRTAKGMPLPPSPPAVIVQRMVEPNAAGVAFSADPVLDQKDLCIVTAVPGLGSALVSGETDANTYYVNRRGRVTHRALANKKSIHHPASDKVDGVVRLSDSDSQAQRAALDDKEIVSVAKLARRMERHFGCPQDIEWAVENERLYLLQSRPITASDRRTAYKGVLIVWDNANIAESYSGVTTPLTFTFARRAYEEVYRQLCETLGVPKAAINAHSDTFTRMLGFIRGRIYYNLLSWYRILALLPGFSTNRRFMEQMMGVDQSLSEALRFQEPASSLLGKFRDQVGMVSTGFGLIANHILLPYKKRRFRERLDQTLAPTNPPLEEMPPDALGAHYRDLERQLLAHWDAPLINDLFAMIFFGTLRKLLVSWCGDQETGLHNDLLCGEGGMVSVEPARRMQTMARIARQNPKFADILTAASNETILEAMTQVPDFQHHYHDYLDAFGERCFDELKLESSTVLDDPTSLLRAVGRIATSTDDSEHNTEQADATVRHKAEERVSTALSWSPLRKLFLRWVLRQTRVLVRDRENLRFERTRVFGRARRIFVTFGRRFHELGLLAAPEDIFYLEVNEVLGLVEGTASTVRLKNLVEVRRAEFKDYANSEPPPNRLETRGMVGSAQFFKSSGGSNGGSEASTLKGLGAAAGTVRGPARLVSDPRAAALCPGDILVARRTDPGWIVLFMEATGILVEHGSLLSHAAIVARELDIPTVVSLPGLMDWLEDGDLVELDGASGIIRRIGKSSRDADPK